MGLWKVRSIHFECVYLEYGKNHSEQRELGKFWGDAKLQFTANDPQVYQNVLIDKSALFFVWNIWILSFFWGQSQKPKKNPVRQPGGNLGFYCVKFTWLAGKSPIFDMRYTFIHGWVYPVSWIFSGEVSNHKASFEGAKLKQVSEKEDLHLNINMEPQNWRFGRWFSFSLGDFQVPC